MKEKNFKFKESYARTLKSMSDKQAGQFIKAVCGYVFQNVPFETKDKFLKGTYLYMQRAIDEERVNVKYGKVGGAIRAEQIKAERQSGGGMGGIVISIEHEAKPPKN